MWNLDITNVAGIRSGRASLARGVNVVRADNWRGKSSLLRAVRTVMGTTGLDGERHPLTEGASAGAVELETGERTYRTELVREDGRVRLSGETYLTDETDRVCARLFAFLGEDNPVRAAVRNGDDLSGLLQRPLDTENIDERIADRKRERREVEEELATARSAAEEIPAVRGDIARLEERLESLRADRADLEADASDRADVREELSERRAALDRVEADIERIRNAIERGQREIEDRRADLADLTVPDEPEVDVAEARDRIGELDARIDLLSDLYSANKRVLDEGRVDLVTAVERTVAGDEFDCWLCGETTAEAELRSRLDAIDATVDDLRAERDELQAEIEAVRRRERETEEARRERSRLEDEIADLETDVEERRAALERKRERRDALESDIEDLEARLDSAGPDADAELASVEGEIKLVERDLAERREELDDLRARADGRDRLEAEYDDLTDRIERLRTRKRDKQRELKDRFERRMAEVVEVFDPGFEGARLDLKTGPDGEVAAIDLVVAREGRRTRIDALSEGEVELLGVVVALAGYETFGVDERVPAILLDEVGGLTGGHVRDLVSYLRDRAEILVTTAYPGADELEGHTVSPEEWEVVSDDRAAPA